MTNCITIGKLANGYCIELPFQGIEGSKSFLDDPEAYGKVLGEVMKARDKDNLGLPQEDEEKPKAKKKSTVIANDQIYIFSDLDEALEFAKYKLQH